MIENDVIEPVNGPTPWVSPVVPVPKPDPPNEERICTDAREMNKAILRTKHPFPTVEDLAVKLNGAKYISKYDLKSGYNQLYLHESSRYIIAFCTHIGVFQYKRLNFCINAASEIFQKTIEQVLSGLDGCVNISDDIIYMGNRFCKILWIKIRWDIIYTKHNRALTVYIDLKKCDALLNAQAPKGVGEVRSLLGLVNYCSRFIPDYATVVKPLRQLTKKSALNFFDPKLRTEVTVDASPVGVAAVLAQYDPKMPNEKHVIMYASRSLTKVEQRYSQIEREALAVVWVCQFHLYIYAKEFDIITDNKAVELIFGNVRSKPKARIERWCLRFFPYKFVIKHKSGAFNIADHMSRNPTEPADNSTERFTESYINMVSTFGIPKAISRSDLFKGTKEDEQLIEVAKMVQGLNWPSEMPDAPCVLTSIDFYGPLKCGKYLLVLVCEYSRFPIVKVISSTTGDVVISALNEIFSIIGIPKAVKSDNGPPFNSYKFKQFSLEQVFIHKKITPLWPRSNGMCERFMRNLVENQVHEKAKLNDAKAKAKMKTFNDRNLRAQVSQFTVGDKVLLKWKRSSKSDTYFDIDPFKIIEINGSMITVERN
ncbi:unnamed protein product, partial [Brachionus calyciflorus]